MQTDPELGAAIRERFGEKAYAPGGKLDRGYLARLVFGDPAALAALNALVHPAVARDAANWHAGQSGDYSLHEAAIIYEIGSAEAYDAVVVVIAPAEIRAGRVMKRDGSTREQFEERAARQWTEERKAAAADFLIENDGRQLLLPQILRVDHQLRDLAAHFTTP
jgi:dephospho-CoA kinase